MATRKKPSSARRPAKTASARKAGQAAKRRRKKPETLRLRSVTVGLTVNDIARSVAWYRDVLGFVVADEWRVKGELHGAEVKAGSVSLFLGQDDWKKGRDRKKGEGIRLYCRTAQSVDRLAADIKARGGILSHEPETQSWGERDFGLVDPDGFKITITTGA